MVLWRFPIFYQSSFAPSCPICFYVSVPNLANWIRHGHFSISWSPRISRRFPLMTLNQDQGPFQIVRNLVHWIRHSRFSYNSGATRVSNSVPGDLSRCPWIRVNVHSKCFETYLIESAIVVLLYNSGSPRVRNSIPDDLSRCPWIRVNVHSKCFETYLIESAIVVLVYNSGSPRVRNGIPDDLCRCSWIRVKVHSKCFDTYLIETAIVVLVYNSGSPRVRNSISIDFRHCPWYSACDPEVQGQGPFQIFRNIASWISHGRFSIQ